MHLFLYIDLGVELSAKGQWRSLEPAALEPALEYLRYGNGSRGELPVTLRLHNESAHWKVQCGSQCTGQVRPAVPSTVSFPDRLP